MKNLLFILLTSIAFTSVNAQTNLAVTVCENAGVTSTNKEAIEVNISQEKLLKCNELLSNDAAWKVNSFVFAIHIEGSMYEMKGAGNMLSKRMIALITKYNPEKIYLEKIKLVKGEETSTDVLPLVLLMN